MIDINRTLHLPAEFQEKEELGWLHKSHERRGHARGLFLHERFHARPQA